MTETALDTVVFNRGAGEGLIVEGSEWIELDTEPKKLGQVELKAGEETDLEGYWREPLTYCGNRGNQLVFFIGQMPSDLFGAKRYYQVINWITEERFYSAFSYQSGRDFNYRKGEWK